MLRFIIYKNISIKVTFLCFIFFLECRPEENLNNDNLQLDKKIKNELKSLNIHKKNIKKNAKIENAASQNANNPVEKDTYYQSKEKYIQAGEENQSKYVINEFTRSGLYICVHCNNCKNIQWKYLGIGYFNVAEATDYVSCNACGEKIGPHNLLGVSFFDCNYKVKGKRVKNPEKFPKDVNYEQFCFDKKTQKDKIEKYFSKISGFLVYLIITTSKIK